MSEFWSDVRAGIPAALRSIGVSIAFCLALYVLVGSIAALLYHFFIPTFVTLLAILFVVALVKDAAKQGRKRRQRS